MPSSIFFPMDGDTRPIIDRWHHECHEGKVYGWHYENLLATSGLTTYIHIKTGTKPVHCQAEFGSLGGTLQILWFEAPTLATVGTVISANNRNRLYKNIASETLLYLNTTVTTVGSVYFGARAALGSSVGLAKVGSNIVGEAERILDPNTDYLIRTITGAASMLFTIDGLFYEEEMQV